MIQNFRSILSKYLVLLNLMSKSLVLHLKEMHIIYSATPLRKLINIIEPITMYLNSIWKTSNRHVQIYMIISDCIKMKDFGSNEC